MLHSLNANQTKQQQADIKTRSALNFKSREDGLKSLPKKGVISPRARVAEEGESEIFKTSRGVENNDWVRA